MEGEELVTLRRSMTRVKGGFKNVKKTRDVIYERSLTEIIFNTEQSRLKYLFRQKKSFYENISLDLNKINN